MTNPISLHGGATLTINGFPVTVSQGSTILDALNAASVETPRLCFLEGLTPVNACRLCVVELEGARTLVPACSRRAEQGMVVLTDSVRVKHARKLVLELLLSSVDLSLLTADIARWIEFYGADLERFGKKAARAETNHDACRAGSHEALKPGEIGSVATPVKIDNDLFVRDYSKCILCYRCVEACGADAQNTFAIAVAGRGFEARISTEFVIPLNESACVFCGNCIGVCPTGALMPKSEFDMREVGNWCEEKQAVTRTVCPYCGVGCNLELTVQDDRIVKASSPRDHDITNGNLCIKGRFGWEYVNSTPERRGSGEKE